MGRRTLTCARFLFSTALNRASSAILLFGNKGSSQHSQESSDEDSDQSGTFMSSRELSAVQEKENKVPKKTRFQKGVKIIFHFGFSMPRLPALGMVRVHELEF